MDTRSRVADWISIITGPFTVLSIVGALTGWLPGTVSNNADSYEKRLALALILTSGQWFFLFSLMIRYFKVQALGKSDLGFLLSIVLGVVGLAPLMAFELIMLHAVIFPVSNVSLVLWLGIPALAWLSFGLVALLIIRSE